MKLLLALSMFLVGACASLAESEYEKPPALELRTLLISTDKPGFLEYPYRVCQKKNIFGKCKTQLMVKDYYNLADPEVAAKLKNMQFVVMIAGDPLKVEHQIEEQK